MKILIGHNTGFVNLDSVVEVKYEEVSGGYNIVADTTKGCSVLYRVPIELARRLSLEKGHKYDDEQCMGVARDMCEKTVDELMREIEAAGLGRKGVYIIEIGALVRRSI